MIYEIYGVELVVEVIRVGYRKDVGKRIFVNAKENSVPLVFPEMVFPWDVPTEAPGRGEEVSGANLLSNRQSSARLCTSAHHFLQVIQQTRIKSIHAVNKNNSI